VQRSNYLNLTPEEQILMRSRDNLSTQVHCAIQIGYFKAKHRFFPFKWDEVQEDIDFIIQEYFPEQQFHPTPISKHQYYAQCTAITTHFGYQSWSKEFEPLLIAQAQQILRRDVSPQFIVIELLAFMQKKKILRPGYTTLQTIVSKVLNAERNRLEVILRESLTIDDKSALQKLLLEKEAETLSGLADLKQDTKDFKARMISAEREKLLSIKPLYKLAKSLLPTLNLSQQNVHYYASLVDYYDVYELRKKLKSEQTYLYLLCYLSLRYLQLNDNLIDAFFLSLKQFEADLKEKTKDAYTDYAVSKQIDSFVMRRFARLFINQELHDQLSFGDVRKKAFETIIPEEELRHKIPEENEEELKPIDFQWKLVDTLFHRCQLQLRPLMMAIDFSSTADESPWLKAITWLKELFGANKTINQYPVTATPEKIRPKRLEKYLFDTNAKGEKKFHADRYEFWIYRQLKKRLKAGELYLADSIQNRSLQQELRSAKEKESLVEPLDIPALRKPIKTLLDERCAELRSEWLKFNTDFTQGKLKHLYYDEKTKTLHLKKSSDEKRDEDAQHRFYEQLPLCDITDVLRFVNERSRYSSAFTLLQPRYAKLLADENTLNAVIIAQALNNGNLNMAEISDIP
jgi:hypothetical protein